MKKIIRDGKVAVLISPGFGAGWSTWNYEYPEMIFDPDIVEVLESNPIIDPHDADESYSLLEKIKSIAEKKYPDAYLGGADDLRIVWIEKGTNFIVDEYDGSESIRTRESVNWLVA